MKMVLEDAVRALEFNMSSECANPTVIREHLEIVLKVLENMPTGPWIKPEEAVIGKRYLLDCGEECLAISETYTSQGHWWSQRFGADTPLPIRVAELYCGG